jgi:hypothetical protein
LPSPTYGETTSRDESVRFVPARWLVFGLAVSRLVLRSRRLGTAGIAGGIAGLTWAFLPRTLKLVAVGIALAAAVVLLGSMAAIALLVMQLS